MYVLSFFSFRFNSRLKADHSFETFAPVALTQSLQAECISNTNACPSGLCAPVLASIGVLKVYGSTVFVNHPFSSMFSWTQLSAALALGI